MSEQGLDFENVEIRFAQGLDTKSNAKFVIPGKWTDLQNYTLSADYSLTKRNGVSTLVDTATYPLTKATTLATFNDELVAVSGSAVSSLTSFNSSGGQYGAKQAAGQTGWIGLRKGEVARAVDTKFSTSQEQIDFAYGGGVSVYAWIDTGGAGNNGGVSMMAVDEATGAVILQPVQVSSTGTEISPRVVYVSGCFFVMWGINGTGLWAVTYRPLVSATQSAAQNVVAGVGIYASIGIDACPFSGSVTGVGVVMGWNDGTTSVRAFLLTQSGGVITTAQSLNVVTFATIAFSKITAVAICQSGTGGSARPCIMVAATSTAGIPGVSAVYLSSSFTTTGQAGPTQVANVTINNASSLACATGLCGVGQAADNRVVIYVDNRAEANTAGVGAISMVSITVSATVITTAFAVRSLVSSNTYPTNGSAVPTANTAAGMQGPFIWGKPIPITTTFDSGSGLTASDQVLLPVFTYESYVNTQSTTNTLNLQMGLYLLDGRTGVVVARGLLGAFGGARANTGSSPSTAPSVSTPSSVYSNGTQWVLPVLETLTPSVSQTTNAGVVTYTNTKSVTTLARVLVTTAPTIPQSRAQIGTATYLSGGVLTTYEKGKVTEAGFLWAPEGISYSLSGSATGASITKQYVAVYEWYDGSGQRHQSAPSLPLTVTYLANQVVTIIVPTIQLTQKLVTISCYATDNNGTIFYRCWPPNRPWPNDQTVAYISIADTAWSTSNEPLYTQPTQAGSTLPADSPWPCSALAVFQNRLWFDRLDSGYGVFGYSQQLQNGVGLQFSTSLTAEVDAASSGDITGFAPMDEKVIIFCQRKIYVMVGSGPNPSGGYNNYSDPQEVPSDVGCIEPRSIVKTPQGLIFKSKKGWYLLTRALDAQYIGEGPAAYDAGSPISSGVYLEDRKEVRFTLTGFGAVLVYSTLTLQWSIFVYPFSPGDSIWWSTIGAWVCAIKVNAVPAGLVYEVAPVSPGRQVDLIAGVTTGITGRATTAPIHVGKLEAFQRVRWLYLTMGAPSGATNQPATTFEIDVSFDDAPFVDGASGSYSVIIDLSTVIFSDQNTIDIRHKLQRQKCKSVQFSFVDTTKTPGSSTGLQGMQAMLLNVGMKRGTNKLPDTQTF